MRTTSINLMPNTTLSLENIQEDTTEKCDEGNIILVEPNETPIIITNTPILDNTNEIQMDLNLIEHIENTSINIGEI